MVTSVGKIYQIAVQLFNKKEPKHIMPKVICITKSHTIAAVTIVLKLEQLTSYSKYVNPSTAKDNNMRTSNNMI